MASSPSSPSLMPYSLLISSSSSSPSSSPTSSSSSTSSRFRMSLRKGEYRNWLELPPDITSSILHRIGAIEILENAQKVCRSWRDVCREKTMWQKIDMHNLGDLGSMGYDLDIMCRHAVDRSQGNLVEIDIWYFGTDDLLQYIANSSSNLRRLRLAMCYPISDEGVAEAAVKLPLLEDLEVLYGSLSGDSLKVVGQSCPHLKTFKLNNPVYRHWHRLPHTECDEDALAIAESMPGLRHLQLFGNRLTDIGLKAILDKCLHLEHLDLRQCSNIKFAGNLEKRCSERIKVVRRPNDPTTDYPFDATVINTDSSDDDYPYHAYDFYEFDVDFDGASDVYELL